MIYVIAALAAGICSTACVAPLGAGFRIEQQELSVEYVSGGPPVLRVQAAWRLQNAGNQPLDFVDVGLPDGRTHVRSAPRILLDGQSVPMLLDPSSPSLRVNFAEPLPVGGSREITVSYEISGAKSPAAGTDVTELGFVLPPGDWAPVLVRPNRVFARGGEPPKKWELTLQVPAGWRVHASGKFQRAEANRADHPEGAIQRFEQGPGVSLPFAVAGEYHQEKVSLAGSGVFIWTRQPLPAGLARRFADAVLETTQVYDGAFGPRKNNPRRWWIIECPRKDGCWAVPQAALVGTGIEREDSGPALRAELDAQLAYSWLDFQVHPDWEAEPLPMGALANYAADLAAAAREAGANRARIIQGLLASYDYDKSQEPEPAVLNVQRSDPEPARQFAEVKSELFLYALEDSAGSENLLRALRHLLRTYHGGIWRSGDLRSALELENGENLAPLFREWLVEPGIPEEFRQRYQKHLSGSE